MKTSYYEIALLSACMVGGKSAEVIAKVNADHFSEQFKPVFQVISDCFERGMNPDVVTVWENSGDVEDVGFQKMVGEIAELPPANDVDQYCKELKRLSVGRKLRNVASQIMSWANEKDPETAYQMASTAIMDITANEAGDSLKSFNQIMGESLLDIERRFEMGEGQFDGLPTGFADIDARWMGMKPGNLIIVAGRPGMGKTTFVMNACEYNVRNGKSVLFFSLEMEGKELADKTLSSAGRLSFTRIMSGKLREDDWPKLSAGAGVMKDSKLFVDDRHSLSVAEMRAQAYRVKRESDLDLIVVDYIQLMQSKGDNRENEVSNLSRALKGLAKEMGVPVIAISQLNRKCEERKNKRPINSDLRESGALEQDANQIAFVYRDDVYYDDSPLKGTAEIITSKGRAIKIGTDCLAWRGDFQRFDTLDHRPDVESVIEQQESGGKSFARDF